MCPAYCDSAGNNGKMIVGGNAVIIKQQSRTFADVKVCFAGSISAPAKNRINDVKNHLTLGEKTTDSIYNKNADKLSLADKQKESWHNSCQCLTEFRDKMVIELQQHFEKQNYNNGWSAQEYSEVTLAGTGEPFDYDNSRN